MRLPAPAGALLAVGRQWPGWGGAGCRARCGALALQGLQSPALPAAGPAPATQTREWKEGLVSTTFRDMANNKTNRHQWIVLDGDIDAEWIESMNTVMDDNKVSLLLGCSMSWGCLRVAPGRVRRRRHGRRHGKTLPPPPGTGRPWHRWVCAALTQSRCTAQQRLLLQHGGPPRCSQHSSWCGCWCRWQRRRGCRNERRHPGWSSTTAACPSQPG